jgi:hypothetical protein
MAEGIRGQESEDGFWDNHSAMISLLMAWYNFYRKHVSLKTTLAVVHGLTDNVDK